MKKTPKISLIIPIYNVEQYLGRCLESIVKQSLFDIEIICIDDGTRDNSCTVVDIYMKKDYRIRLFHKENGGLSSARNEGLKYATGEYIWFIDSDDYIEENACERLYYEIIEDYPEIIVFGANTFPLIPWIDNWTAENLSPITGKFKDDDVVNALFYERGSFPFVWRNCFKREFLIRHNLRFDETVRFGEDTIFQFQAFSCASDVTFISDKLYDYRHYRIGSLMNNFNRNYYEKIKYHIIIMDRIAELWAENGILEKYGKEFLQWSFDFVAYELIRFEGEEKKKLIYIFKDLLKKYDLDKYFKKLTSHYKHYLMNIMKI